MKRAFKRAKRNGLLNQRNGLTPLTAVNCLPSTDPLHFATFVRRCKNDILQIYVFRAVCR